MLDLIKEQDDIDKIYLNAKDLSEPKYQFLNQKRENAGIKHLNDFKAFTECSNTIDGYNNINDYNLTRKKNVFDEMIADIMNNKKIQPVVNELIFRCRN